MTPPLDLKKLVDDQDHIGENLRAYLQAFIPSVRDIFENFEFHSQIDKLGKSGLLYMVAEKFTTLDPTQTRSAMPNVELIRKFAELSNETAGVRIPRDGGHDSILMADSVPASSRTAFHGDGGQHSTVMADSIPF